MFPGNVRCIGCTLKFSSYFGKKVQPIREYIRYNNNITEHDHKTRSQNK